jgi:hypothetical protein
VTTVATVAVAGGILFASENAASASVGSESHQGNVVVHQVTQSSSSDHRSNDHSRGNAGHSGYYFTDHGHRFRYDGHRFYQWIGGKWRAVSADYARHHGFDHKHGSSKGHHGDSSHSSHKH